MSPDSIETRFAELRAEVRAWEQQLRMQSGLIMAHERMDERVGGLRRDLDALRSEINQRLHDLHDEQEKEMRREIENLHQRLTRTIDRRDRQMQDFDKRVGDVALTLKANIDECRAEAQSAISTLIGDRTSRRGQNLALLATIVGGALVVIQGIVQQF